MRRTRPEETINGTLGDDDRWRAVAAPASVDLARLSAAKTKRAAVQLPVFHQLEQSVTLPADFKPERVTIEVRPAQHSTWHPTARPLFGTPMPPEGMPCSTATTRTPPRIETLIGRSARVQGDVEFSGGLHIDGPVTGSVRVVPGGAASVSVSEHGVIEGSVEATQRGAQRHASTATSSPPSAWFWAPRRACRAMCSYGVIEMALGAEITGRLIPASAATAQTG